MEFHVLTVFPELIKNATDYSILGRALKQEKLSLFVHDIRDFAPDRHRTTDDEPFGGGAGMVMKPEPIVHCLEHAIKEYGPGYVIVMSAAGRLFKQAFARKLASYERIYLIAGHYEGIDERVVEYFADIELSIGDYVLSGGEYPAMVVIDAVARLLPNVLGNQDSLSQESHNNGLLEYPQYTRPREFRGLRVPDVLLSGNHAEIRKFRETASQEKTMQNRPDMLKTSLTETTENEQ